MRNRDEPSSREWLLWVHAAYGKAMLQAHSLELMLRTLLICYVTTTFEDKKAIEPRVARLKRMPLGVLIDEFMKAFAPNNELSEELDNLLFFRNELAHRISETITNAAAHSNWQEVVIQELEEIHGYFTDAKPLLEPYMLAFHDKLGITKEQLREMAQTIYPGAIGRAA